MERAYPTSVDGMPVSFQELDLRPSQLDLRRPESFSLHHKQFTARRMARLLITQTVRDLEFEQELVPRDQHNQGRQALHSIYCPPEPASLIQYMDRLDVARQTGERMRIRANGMYIFQDISDIHWKQIEQEYNRESD